LQQSSLKDKDTRISTRRAQLQSEQQKRLRDVKDSERARTQQEERVIQQRLDRRRDQGKREEEQRHKAEIQAVKDKYTQKLQLEKERVQLENSRLLEESGDIDYQIRLFKADLQDNQYEQKRAELDREVQERLKVHEGEI
jgi:hypothetical protein